MCVDGRDVRVLIDTGCSITLIDEHAVGGRHRERARVSLQTMSGSLIETQEAVWLRSMQTSDGVELGPVQAHVTKFLPLRVDAVLGLDVILRVGLTILPEREGGHVNFRGANVLCPEEEETEVPKMRIEDEDFEAEFSDQKWVVNWKWERSPPVTLEGRAGCYVADGDRDAFDDEVRTWVKEGILVKYDRESHGEIQRYLPMMSVKQEKGDKIKIRPVFDFRDLNEEIRSHPAGATPLCNERLREWRQLGTDCSVIDLRKAYLQIHVIKPLWVYQAVRWRGETYLLTRLGFGLASAPKIMTKIVEAVIARDDAIAQAVTSYIDDLFVDETKVTSEGVRQHFNEWGLETKEPEKLGADENVRVLGLKVTEDFNWRRDGSLPSLDKDSLTRRQVHAILGELIGHYPVVGWLRVSSAFLQRLTAFQNTGWNDPVSEEVMEKMREIFRRIESCGDPVRGKWPVRKDSPITVWTDASNLAIGVALQIEQNIVEDAAWLRPKADSAHINRAELDAVIRGINLALKWGRREIYLKCDSATVCGWLRAVIEKSRNVRTSALGEILIRRRLDILQDIIAQENLQVSVEYVRSAENLADELTRVPRAWTQHSTESNVLTASAGLDCVSLDSVRAIHERGHFGVDRTLQLAQERYGPDQVSRRMVKKVVSRCQRCARIDPPINFQWDSGHITATKIWERWATDITHFDGMAFLTVIDVASNFAIWRALRSESAQEVTQNMRQIITEFGPPQVLLSDNGTVFRSQQMDILLREWEINHQFSSAYRPQGNGVAERSHRTVKRAARRMGRSVAEAVFWVNNTKSGSKGRSPFELLFCASSKKPGVTCSRREVSRPEVLSHRPEAESDMYDDIDRNPFSAGDLVYLRPPTGRCDIEWSGPHRISAIKSAVSVELDEDGVNRHVAHLRLVPGFEHTGNQDISESEIHASDPLVTIADIDPTDNHSADNSFPRRSGRVRRRPVWQDDYIT